MTAAVATIEPTVASPPALVSVDPQLALIEKALEQGASIETIEKLMELAERNRKTKSEAAFIAALSEALGEIEVIKKDDNATTGNRSFNYATHGAIARAVRPALSRHGLAYTFEPEQIRDQRSEKNGRLKLTCVVSHREGHQSRVTMEAQIQGAPGTSEARQLGGTSTILQRHTLAATLGLAIEEDKSVYSASDEGPDYDAEPVLSAIAFADTMDDLRKIGEAINTGGGERFEQIPKKALGHIRAAYGRRQREIRSAPAETVEAGHE